MRLLHLLGVALLATCPHLPFVDSAGPKLINKKPFFDKIKRSESSIPPDELSVLDLVVQSELLSRGLMVQNWKLRMEVGFADWLKRSCSRSDPKLNECIRDMFQKLFPYMAKGIPEVNMPRFEPLFIDKIGIKKGHGAVILQGTFSSLYAHGPSNTTALYTAIDLDKGKLELGLHIPIIRTESQYDLKGNILLLPLVGVGEAKLLLRNVTTDVKMKISFPKYQGEEVMRVDNMRVDFRLSQCRVHLDNLFNGNKVLGHTVNSFLNKNSLEVVEELKENIGDSLAQLFKRVLNDAFSRIPTKFWLTK